MELQGQVAHASTIPAFVDPKHHTAIAAHATIVMFLNLWSKLHEADFSY
jgi:hypothetical protein